MATIAITVPAALVPRVRAAMRDAFPELAGLSDTAAFQEATARYWRGVVQRYELGLASDANEATARAATQAAAAQTAADVATIA